MVSGKEGSPRALCEGVSIKLGKHRERDLQGSRVAEGLSQITSNAVLWRKIDLLEQLWRDGQAASGSDTIQGMAWVHVFVKVVFWRYISAFVLGAIEPAGTHHCDRC